MLTNNPLLNSDALQNQFIAFTKIAPHHINDAISKRIDQAKQAVAKVTQLSISNVNWDNTVIALEDVYQNLEETWGLVTHLCAVNDTEELRAVYANNLQSVQAFFTDFKQNKFLAQRYIAIEKIQLTKVRQQVLHNALLQFRLGGANLNSEIKTRLGEIYERLEVLAKNFADNLLDATNAYYFSSNSIDELSNIPEDTLASANELAKKYGQSGWRFTLHEPCYLAIMRYADNRQLRERFFRIYATRASDSIQFNKSWSGWSCVSDAQSLDNSLNIKEQLELKEEAAKLLGFANYVELSLATKMAESLEQIDSLMGNLAKRARPQALKEFDELSKFADTCLNLKKLEPWDISYATEKLQQKLYAFATEQLRQYFPVPKALDGLFYVIKNLFKVNITKIEITDFCILWHPDVEIYKIENENGVLLAYCYLDLYARSGKQSGAWMHSAQGKRALQNGQIQIPIAYIVTNFAPPVSKLIPALLTHQDLVTLFHEFGHGLHHMLTTVTEASVAGINGVEWDAVELPSQFLENFCWESEVLKKCSAHIDTGQCLPEVLINKLLASKNFHKGLSTLRQLIFTKFDLMAHTESLNSDELIKLWQQIAAEIGVIPCVLFARPPHSFAHIFAGGYAAGYYSYKWAEVLSADAYALFQETQCAGETSTCLNSAISKRFQEEILQVGGSRPALESFKCFRKRDPDVTALLKQDGLEQH